MYTLSGDIVSSQLGFPPHPLSELLLSQPFLQLSFSDTLSKVEAGYQDVLKIEQAAAQVHRGSDCV
jgi:hypothetical protein